jgi:hypothetical protein
MLAIVAIYSLRFLHGRVAKAYEACRIFVGAAGVLEVNADGFFAPACWLPSAVKRCSAIRHELLSNSRAQKSESQFFILDLICDVRVFGVLIGLSPVFQRLFLFLWPVKGIFAVVFCSVFSCLPASDCFIAFGCWARITEGNSFGARACGTFVVCFLLVRDVRGSWVPCFQLRRILRIWVTVLDLAVSWLSRFQVVVLGLFDFSQSRVSGFFLR